MLLFLNKWHRFWKVLAGLPLPNATDRPEDVLVETDPAARADFLEDKEQPINALRQLTKTICNIYDDDFHHCE